MCLWCCISIVLLKSDRCEKILSDFLWDAHKYPSCCFVSVEIKTIYLEYIQQCFSTVFHLQKWRKAFSTFCKSLIFHIGFSDFDMVNLSNLEIVFYPFMTVAWVPHAPFFRRNVAYFQFLEKLHRLLMCMLRPSKLTADSVTVPSVSFTLTTYTAMVKMWREEVSTCVWEAYALVHFFILWFCNSSEFCFCFTEKKKKKKQW